MGNGDLHLKLTGNKTGVFKGESNHEGHVGEIDVDGWSWSMLAPTDAATGSRTGRVQVRGLVISKGADAATTAIMNAMNANEVVTAELSVRKSGGTKPIDYLVVKLYNATISSFNVDWQETPLPAVIERVEFRFGKLEMTYTGQDKGGAAKGSSTSIIDGLGPRLS